MSIEAAPIVVDPSGDFLGNDGAWSTFLISVGTPPQQLQVLPSTQLSATWTVAPDGCDQSDPANCTDTRGGAYDETKSSSWNVNAYYPLSDEVSLGYNGKDLIGNYGYDKLSIHGGGANVSVDHQVVAAIATKTFYVGNLGLSASPLNFNSAKDSSPSLLTSLKTQNLIPSLSYGYTAGASYRQKNGVSGSLTLGGYDASRLIPNDVSITFGTTFGEQLSVGLRSITRSSSKTETPLLSDSVLALVDSTVPYLWLPQSACTAFEEAFGLIWSDTRNLYLVNDTIHDTLLKENASVIFEIANGPTGGPSTNITLPYASFDLEVDSPLVNSPTRYFPLQRSADEKSATLGRTFLQESFLIVNYEHSNFSLSQASFDPSVPSHIVSIASNSTATTGGTDSHPTATNGAIVKSTIHNGSHGVGTGAIAGIAIAIVLIASLCGAFFLRRIIKRRRALRKTAEIETGETKEMPPFDQERDSKRDFLGDLEVKKGVPTTVTVNEVPLTPPSAAVEADAVNYFFDEKGQPRISVQELAGSPGNRSELSSPEPWSRSELPSPDPDVIRSELSTPEPPMWDKPELPTPDPSHELESPGISSVSSSQPSPPLSDNRSSLSTATNYLPVHRPLSDRTDSSESEAGFTRDGMPQRPFHRRLHSDDSEAPSTLSRPLSSRMDSSDSEVSTSSPPRPRLRAPFPRTDSNSSESESPSTRPTLNPPSTHRIVGLSTPFHSSSSSRPAIRRSIHPVTAGMNRQSDSSDSDAWQTRLDSASTEHSSDMSRFPSVRGPSGVESRGDGTLNEEDESDKR